MIRGLIEKFGGMSAMSRALGHNYPTTVQGWKTSGTIPIWRRESVLSAVEREGIQITSREHKYLSHGLDRKRHHSDKPANDAMEAEWALQLIDQAPDLVCLCRNGKISYINAAGVRWLGLRSKKMIVGQPFTDFVHSDYREIAAELADNRHNESEPMPLKLTPRKGGVIDAEVVFLPFGDSANRTVAIQARNITERLRSANAILSSESRYRNLIEQALDMICVCEGGVVSFINAAGTRILGAKDPAQLIGRKLSKLVHPDYREIIAEGLDSFIDEGTAIPLKFVRLDRKVIDVEVAVMSFGGVGKSSFMMEARDITEQIRSAETLRNREQRLRGIMNSVAEAIITIDEKGVIQSFNPAAETVFGYGVREVLGKNVKILMTEDISGKHDGYIRRYLRSGKPRVIGGKQLEEVGRRKDGSVFPLEISITELRHGKQRLFTGMLRDITERKRAEEDLRKAHDELEERVEERTKELTEEIGERRRAEEKLNLAAKVIANLNEAVVIVDTAFKVTSVNPAFNLITGFSPEEILGQHPPFFKTIKSNKDLNSKMRTSLKRKASWEGEFWCKHKNGEKYAVRLSLSAITDEKGKVQQYAAVLNDITKRKKDEERIHYQANYDTLTDLPNRSLFHDRLNQSLPSMMRLKAKLGLMFIDLDGFKLINDTLGHDCGDILLQETSNRLSECIRDGDTVARLGGDEFTVIMPNLHDPQNAPLLAQRILDGLNKPFDLKGQEAFISCSIGITIYPDDATEAADLIKNADAAMYRAKEQGKANYQFFTADLNEDVKERLVLKTGLNKALERNEFVLHYQPKLDINSGRVNSCEALMRWVNDDLGMVSPVRFIPIIEETGQVVEIGEWALRTACEQHIAWREQGLPPLRIAVNLSARQLREVSFVKIVEDILKETGVEPDGLEIEITESMLMSDSAKAVVALDQLHDMGLHVAMDDFGTGYSSLSYLKRFPIDTIKIDRSFVNDITTSPDDAEIIRTIITMGQTLNRKIVAEGVETEDQLELLRSYRCDEIQGYIFSRPLPADGMMAFFEEKGLL